MGAPLCFNRGMAEAGDERRIVTALFADVAGSTALSERLDAEEAKLVIGGAISRAIRSGNRWSAKRRAVASRLETSRDTRRANQNITTVATRTAMSERDARGLRSSR